MFTGHAKPRSKFSFNWAPGWTFCKLVVLYNFFANCHTGTFFASWRSETLFRKQS